ncbi:putative DNAJ-like protein [Trypanosoma vivax]|nr:putative DNAJ-like protein [Trypanosoma vivax]
MILLPSAVLPQIEADTELPILQHCKARNKMVKSVDVLPCGLALQMHAVMDARILMELKHTARLHNDPQATDRLGLVDGDDSASDSDSGEGHLSASGDVEKQANASRRKKFVKLTEEDLHVDWYEVLSLGQGTHFTDEQIRTAYRRRCLETHPDKQQDRSDFAFKRVQRALDILGDPETRLAYDSSRPFDDAIPSETLPAGANFYTVFGPVFERNKRWSVEKNLPSLGDDQTKLSDVNKFYDRWERFQSWRDFSHMADIVEIDEGMPREEKRFYMRENERQLSRLRRDEQQRLRTLVERARKNDPRLMRKRMEEEARRVKEQQEREERRRQLREEAERKRAEEAERERQRVENEQRRASDVKNAIRQAQKKLVEFFHEHGLLDDTETNKLLRCAVRRPNVSWIFSKIQTEEEAVDVLTKVTNKGTERRPVTMHADDASNVSAGCGEAENCEVDAVLCFNALVEEKEQQIGMTRYGESIKMRTCGLTAGNDGAKKKSGSVGVTNVEIKQWDEEDLVRLQKATAKYPPGTVDRWSRVVEMLRGKFSEEEAMAKVNEITTGLANNTVVAGSSRNNSVNGGGDRTAKTGGVVVESQIPSVENWSVVQQKMLESGLRELKDYTGKDKFQKIAAGVEGKTARDCFERFKYLCAMNKRK